MVPVLHRKPQGATGIEHAPASQTYIACISSIQPIRLSKFWMSRIAFEQENVCNACDTHGASIFSACNDEN